MTEISTTRRIAVGVFIVLGILILMVGIFTIGGQHKAFVRTIRLHVIFDDVQGLQPGNNIWLSGMKVGTVKTIAFYGKSQVAVTLNVEKAAQPHIRKDSKARVGTDGLVDNKIIVIDGGNAEEAVNDNDSLSSENVAGMQQMMTTLQA